MFSLANDLGIDTFVKCEKHRNTSTGQLSGFEAYCDDLKGQPCIIVDDICDGGGTFLGIAEELKKKNAGDLYLVVSHGIFSKGLKDLASTFNAIFTTNSFRNVSGSEFEIRNERYIHKLNIIPIWTSILND